MSGRGKTLSRTGSAVLETRLDRTQIRREVKDVFARYDRGHDGFIDPEDLKALLRDLNGKEPTQTEVLFVLRGVDVSNDGKISFEEMCDYWERVRAGHGGAKYNKLLVKDRVGTVRTSSYDLPPVDHSFGKKNEDQEFGAKEVVGSWVGKEGESPKKGHDFAPTIKIDSYGRPNRPSTPVGSVIKCEFAGEAATAKDTTYPAMPTRKREHFVPKSTVAAELRSTAVKGAIAAAATETKPWKMKKFEKVKSRLVAGDE